MGTEVDDRLYVRANEPVAHRDAELVRERGHADFGLVVEHHDVVAAAPWPMHRGVGAAQQLRGLVAALAERDAEARPD